MSIINLTQHIATPEQNNAGVVEPYDKKDIQALLTFDTLPTALEIGERARKLANIAKGHDSAMIGGAGYLMPALEHQLRLMGVQPLHAFTRRTVRETVLPDGTTKKESLFVHDGFVVTNY